MKSHIKLVRIHGVELGLHYSWILIAALITFSLGVRFRYTNPQWSTATIWTSAVVTGALFFVGLFIHEFSHAMVAKARGLPIHQITLFFLGGVAQIEREPQDAATEFWVAIAGPIASIVLGFICVGVAHVLFGWNVWTLPETPGAAVLVWLGYINLLLAAFNLIPGFPMDGGRVLRAVLWWRMHNGNRATAVAARVGQVVGWLFILWGILRAFSGAGFAGLWIALIGWFLIQAAGSTAAQTRAAALLRGVTVNEAMSRDCIQVDADTNLQSFIDFQLRGPQQHCFLVIEQERLAGLVSVADIRKLNREQWPLRRVRDVMRPLGKLPAVTPETPVLDALERMGREGAAELPVVAGGYFQGVVSRARILQLLQLRSELKAA